MEKVIQEKLREIQEKEEIEILLAVESGSRAWDFASPDSDYDVRFIYLRKEQDYLKLETIRDVIEWQLDDVLDINGWDVQKALRLLYRSNPTLFEWCASPVVYYQSEKFQLLKDILPQYFSKKKSLYHYWHMAKTNYRDYLKQDYVKVKKYFYVLRPILAGKWVVNNGTPPPMIFTELVEAELEVELQPIVYDLLEQKVALNELDLVPKVQVLNEYIEKNIEQMEEQAKDMVEEPQDWSALNQLFLDLLTDKN